MPYETMRFKNPTKFDVKLNAIGLSTVKAGEEIDIPLELCAPGRGSNGARSASCVESVAPQLVPVSEIDQKAWQETPEPPQPISRIVSISKQPTPVESPGVKALREQKERASAQALASAKAVDPKAPQKAQG